MKRGWLTKGKRKSRADYADQRLSGDGQRLDKTGRSQSALIVERQLLLKADIDHFRTPGSCPLRKQTLDAVDRASAHLLGRPTGAIDPERTPGSWAAIPRTRHSLPIGRSLRYAMSVSLPTLTQPKRSLH